MLPLLLTVLLTIPSPTNFAESSLFPKPDCGELIPVSSQASECHFYYVYLVGRHSGKTHLLEFTDFERAKDFLYRALKKKTWYAMLFDEKGKLYD